MTKIRDLHRRWSKDADYSRTYEALGEEFDLARTLIEARHLGSHHHANRRAVQPR
jgi:hypothetical protein